MKRKDVKIAWAIGLDGEIKHVEDVKRGQSCDCICYECKNPLIAKQGESKRWHFSHAVETDCEGESALHLGAKKALMNAAENGLHILLPEANGSVEQVDMLGDVHRRDWVFEDRHLKLCSAEMEKGYSDLRVDVLCNEGEQSEVAVEIFVTHKKNSGDEIKFEKQNLNSIEIDLSQLEWHSNETDILDAVLRSAPRVWLYCKVGARLEAEAADALRDHVESLNGNYVRDYEGSVKGLIVNNEFRSLRLPSIMAEEGGFDRAGKAHTARVFIEPRVIEVLGISAREPGVYIIRVQISIKTGAAIIDVIISMLRHGVINTEWPYLSLSYDRSSKGGRKMKDLSFCGRWHNIGDWNRNIKKIARSKLKEKIDGSDMLSISRDPFCRNFRSMSDKDRLSQVCAMGGFPQPEGGSNFSPSWNTNDDVWKALVFYEHIQTSWSKVLDADLIAGDIRYAFMFDLQVDSKSIKDRAVIVSSWLDKLSDFGYVSRSGKYTYNLLNPFLGIKGSMRLFS